MDDILKSLGLAFGDIALVERYYAQLHGIALHDLSLPDQSGFFLDLNSLPVQPNYKEAVIKWLVAVNLPRIKVGAQPIFTLSIVKQCPVFKIVKMPLKKLVLTPEKMFNRPGTPKQIGQASKSKGINKKN